MSKTPEVPKQRTNKSKTGSRRSHILIKLRRTVNATSPVKALSKTELKKLVKKQQVAETKAKPSPSKSKLKTAKE